MSNPLKWFRKYEKFLLGIFGVLLMIAFTFSLGVSGLSLTDFANGRNGGGGPSSDEVVATWSAGELRESDFANLRSGRAMLIEFTRAAFMQTQERGGQLRAPTIPFDMGDGALLALAILSQKAESMGLQISDQGVLDYLMRLTDQKLKPTEFKGLWNTLTSGRASDAQLISLLRRELLAMRLQEMLSSGSYPESPLRRWENYNRLERTIQAEVTSLPVSKFVDQVPDPAAREVEEFFAKYKHQYPYPGSPEPGFRVREKAAFEYIKLDFEQFVMSEIDRVTPEEIAEYYEKNKDSFREQSFLEEDLKIDDVPPAPESGTAVETGGTTVDDAMPATEEAEGTTDSEANPEASPPGPDTSESSIPDTPMDAGGASEDGDTGTPAKEPQATPSPLPQEADLPTTETAASEPQPEQEMTTAESVIEVEAADEGMEDADIQVVEVVDDEAGDADEPKATDADDTDADDLSVAEKEAVDEPAKYKPLEKVADEIRRTIARPRAQEKFEATLAAVRTKLDRYYGDQVSYQIKRDRGLDVVAPTLPDFSDFESDIPIRVESTPLVDEVEIENYDIGKAYSLDFQGGEFQQTPFNAVAFSPVPLFKANQFPRSEAATEIFLYWRVELKESYEPKLDEVREQVIAAWKKQKAVDLAKVEAERLVAKAADGELSLSESLIDDCDEFFETPEISWYTGGDVPFDPNSVPQVTPIAGLDDPSYELYERLFSLPVGKVGYGLNAPQDTVYIFRIREANPDLSVLQAGFLQNAVALRGLDYIREAENRRMLTQGYEDLLEGNDVEWKREPESGQRNR